LVNSLPTFEDYNKLTALGRFVVIKFKHEKEALRFYIEKNKLSFPLIGNRKGSPNIQPTELLKEYIDKN
jgi:hypothetical protein